MAGPKKVINNALRETISINPLTYGVGGIVRPLPRPLLNKSLDNLNPDKFFQNFLLRMPLRKKNVKKLSFIPS